MFFDLDNKFASPCNARFLPENAPYGILKWAEGYPFLSKKTLKLVVPHLLKPIWKTFWVGLKRCFNNVLMYGTEKLCDKILINYSPYTKIN